MRKYTLKKIERFILDAGSDCLAVFGGSYEGGVHIQQVPDEIGPCIFAMLKSKKPIHAMLEVGSASGGTVFVINRFLSPSQIVIVDDNHHPKHILRAEILKGLNCREIIGNSRDNAIIEQARGLFDLIIIDGDHSYQGVRADIENYLPMLNDGGFLMLHDVATTAWGCAVPQVFEEMKQDGRVKLVGAYISSKYPVCGVGLFRKVSE